MQIISLNSHHGSINTFVFDDLFNYSKNRSVKNKLTETYAADEWHFLKLVFCPKELWYSNQSAKNIGTSKLKFSSFQKKMHFFQKFQAVQFRLLETLFSGTKHIEAIFLSEFS